MKIIIVFAGLLIFLGSCSCHTDKTKSLVEMEIRSTGGYDVYVIKVYADSTIYCISGEGEIGRDYYDTIYAAKSVQLGSSQMKDVINALDKVKTHYKKSRSEKPIMKDTWEYFFYIEGKLYHLNIRDMNSDKSFNYLFELLKELSPIPIELRGFA